MSGPSERHPKSTRGSRDHNESDYGMFANSVDIVILMQMNRREVTNAHWERRQPLLPPQEPQTSRPAVVHRRILNSILWILRFDALWRALPGRYSP